MIPPLWAEGGKLSPLAERGVFLMLSLMAI